MNLSGSDFIFITLAAVLAVLLIISTVYLQVFRKKNHNFLNRYRKEANFERELSLSRIEIKEQTLDYIGHELHEDLGQKLSVARLLTSKVAALPQEERTKIVKEVNALLGETLQDIRNLSAAFIRRGPGTADFVDLVESEIFRIRRLGFPSVEYSIENRNALVNLNHEIILFRLVQQSLNLLVKHSHRHSMKVSISEGGNRLKIVIEEDSTAYSTLQIEEKKTLNRMQNRGKFINCRLLVQPLEPQGVRITLLYNQ